MWSTLPPPFTPPPLLNIFPLATILSHVTSHRFNDGGLLVGVDHVAIGTNTGIGDSVGVGEVVMGRPGPTPARYLNGLESPADGKTSSVASSPEATPTRMLARSPAETRWRYSDG